MLRGMRSEPATETRDLFGPCVFGWQVRSRYGVMSSLENTIDSRAQNGGHAFFAAGEDGCPWGVEENVADSGLAMQQDGNASLERLDCRDAVALDRGHEEKVSLREHLLQIFVGDEAVKMNAAADAEVLCHLAKRGDERAFASEVETPVDTRGEGSFALFECGQRAKDPVDAFVGFDSTDGEHAEVAVYGTGEIDCDAAVC